MRYLAIALMLAGCDSAAPYTWGDASEELAQVYCGGLVTCGAIAPSGVAICAEHTPWHLCAAEGTCGVEVDRSTTETALAACDAAVGQLDDFGCYLLNVWGSLPAECADVWALEPGAP